MPNLLIFSPVEICGWLFASISGLTRSATRATSPRRVAVALDARKLAGDSTLMALSRAAPRIELGHALADAGKHDVGSGEAGLRASSISQIELASAALPSSAAGARSPASSWPSARSAARAGSCRRPRRSRGTARAAAAL
jgi:hypothetical protein